MPVLIFSGLMAAPATVFAEASWYGSLRGGIEFASGMDAKFYDGASRWGIKGSGEISEGLTAVYRFEHKFSTADAGQAGGRLAFVGLDGGFGKVTLGQIWSASYNHAGVIRDFPNWYTSGDTTGRIGNALSYAFSADAFSVQVDAIMDGGKDTGKAIDQLEFGMTVNLGDIGKIALAHTKIEDELVAGAYEVVVDGSDLANKFPKATSSTTEANKGTLPIYKIKVTVAKNSPFYDSTTKMLKDHTEVGGTQVKQLVRYRIASVADIGDGETAVSDRRYRLVRAPDDITGDESAYPAVSVETCNAKDATAADACVTAEAYVALLTSTETDTTGLTDQSWVSSYTINTLYFYLPGDEIKARKNYGSKSNHLSAQFGIGAITVALGHSQMKSNDPMKTMKQKTNFVGASGSIGDTGLNWGAYHREIKNPKNAAGKHKLWTVGLKKTLGGGASTYVEHHNNEKNKGHTVVGLRVDF